VEKDLQKEVDRAVVKTVAAVPVVIPTVDLLLQVRKRVKEYRVRVEKPQAAAEDE
jgi:hypothetical protein